jgi:tRNA(Ile)-lysidine synthase
MLQFRVFDIEGQLDFEKDRKVAYMDADQIPDEIYIRSVINGDRFKPLGLGGTKKIRDFFIDQKIPREKRENIPVLAGTKEILWVIGWRIDERFKVTPITRRVIRAQIVESQ